MRASPEMRLVWKYLSENRVQELIKIVIDVKRNTNTSDILRYITKDVPYYGRELNINSVMELLDIKAESSDVVHIMSLGFLKIFINYILPTKRGTFTDDVLLDNNIEKMKHKRFFVKKELLFNMEVELNRVFNNTRVEWKVSERGTYHEVIIGYITEKEKEFRQRFFENQRDKVLETIKTLQTFDTVKVDLASTPERSAVLTENIMEGSKLTKWGQLYKITEARWLDHYRNNQKLLFPPVIIFSSATSLSLFLESSCS